MEHDDNTVALLIPLFGIFCAFGAPVLAFVVFRVLAHRERIEMIRRGMPPTGRMRDWNVKQGVAPPPSGVVYAPPSYNEQYEDARCTLRRGITTAFIGFGLLVGLSFIGYSDGTIRPGPWLLGGLIPLFVGLAQVIIALLSGATLGPPRYDTAAAPNPNLYGVPSPPPGAQPTAGFEGSYTYRPGAAPELRKPSDIERG